jgi:hypothetical protein
MSRVSNKLRVANMAVVPPRSEANIYVTCALTRLCLITGPNSRRISPISLARGVAEVHPQAPFLVRVIKLSAKEVCIPRNMVIGYAEAQPEQILTLDESSLTGKAESPIVTEARYCHSMGGSSRSRTSNSYGARKGLADTTPSSENVGRPTGQCLRHLSPHRSRPGFPASTRAAIPGADEHGKQNRRRSKIYFPRG